MSEQNTNSQRDDAFRREYDRLYAWRERWMRLSNSPPRKRSSRTQTRLDRVEERVRIANENIGKLIAAHDIGVEIIDKESVLTSGFIGLYTLDDNGNGRLISTFALGVADASPVMDARTSGLREIQRFARVLESRGCMIRFVHFKKTETIRPHFSISMISRRRAASSGAASAVRAKYITVRGACHGFAAAARPPKRTAS